MLKKQIDRKIHEMALTIAGKFNPEKIVLFGSYAWGKPKECSDVDLFVVKNTTGSTREVAREIDKILFWRDIALDIIVDKPAHVKERLLLGDPFFKKIFGQGKILYEAK